ncbi:MAG TPA: HAD family hydrolase [Selenomonas sp.]|nr:HAD family hydrolase [Selenomonas sp.]
MIKLILSDMDGTLLKDNGQLPEGFDEVMTELKKRGVLFGPASGRQYYSLLDSFPAYENEFLFVAENGTMVKYQQKELFSSPIRKSFAFQVMEAGLKLPDIFCVYCGKKDAYIVEEQEKPEYLAELAKYYTHNSVVKDFREVDDEVIKVSFYDKTGHASKTIYPHLQQFQGRMQVVRSSDFWVDVMCFGINKGLALQQVQKKLRISPMECAVFGDYLNDLEIMSSAYYSFAMANAHHKIKEVARFETTSNEEGGVLAGIRRLMDEGLI